MANSEFDFGKFQEQKFSKYLKNECKPMALGKSNAGIFLQDLKMAGKKEAGVFIPFKKMAEAVILFKEIKAQKHHKIQKVALVEVAVESKTNEISLTIKKGSLGLDKLQPIATEFFQKYFSLALKAAASADIAVEEASEDKKEKIGAVDPAAKAKREASYLKIEEHTAKLKQAAGKLDAAKVQENIAKLEGALAKMEQDADADDVVRIEGLRRALKSVDAATTTGSVKEGGETKKKGLEPGQKLTPENREKMQANMNKMQAHLEKMLKDLGVEDDAPAK